jgi:hypothetical protein
MLRRVFLAALIALWPALAFAHTGNGPHGGPVADAGPYYVELLVKDSQLTVYVFDEQSNNPVAVAGAKGTATVLVGQQKETVSLAAGGGDPNMMGGKLGLSAGAGSRIVVLIELAGKPPVIARFAI